MTESDLHNLRERIVQTVLREAGMPLVSDFDTADGCVDYWLRTPDGGRVIITLGVSTPDREEG